LLEGATYLQTPSASGHLRGAPLNCPYDNPYAAAERNAHSALDVTLFPGAVA
jgi:hypothetical protein